MTTKRISTPKLFLSIAMVVVLSLSLLLTALAGPWSEGTGSGNPAKAALTKLFKTPVNTTNPGGSFRFVFTPLGMVENDVLITTNIATMPPIPQQTISIAAGAAPADTTVFAVGDSISYVKESGDFLATLGPASWGNGEGIYRYRVEEVEAQSNIPIVNSLKETAVYSQAWYEIEIWVVEDPVTKLLYAKYVYGKIVVTRVDEFYEGEDPGKLDPTPGGKNEHITVTIEDDFSQIIFTNKYWKTDGDKEAKKTALEVTKTINGAGAVLTTYFNFTITVTQSSVIKPQQSYMAYVLDSSNNIVTDAQGRNGTYDGYEGANGYFTFVSGTPKTISLTNGQRLGFVDLHVGSLVAVQEAANNEYTPKYQRTFTTAQQEFTGVAGSPWGFPRNTEPLDVGPHYIEEGFNHNIVKYTNTRTGATPTGLDVDDLPYVILISLAIVGLAGFVAYKATFKATRKRAHDGA